MTGFSGAHPESLNLALDRCCQSTASDGWIDLQLEGHWSIGTCEFGSTVDGSEIPKAVATVWDGATWRIIPGLVSG